MPDGDRYIDQTTLGQGAMGRVSGARDERLRRVVARKEARGPVGTHSPIARRLAQEAWITARLEHPGVVPIYDAGTTPEGRVFYTMRMVRGRSLSEHLAEAPELGQRLALVRALRDVCEAVGYAHAQGVIHRDLKPANLMIGSYGEAQVVDWGLARLLSDEEAEDEGGGWVPDDHAAATRVGAVLGTPAYMAPEQALGAPADRRSDVWALGCILYQLLTGAAPLAGPDTERILARLRAPRELALEGLGGAPPELVAICRRALSRNADQRHAHAKELADELTAWLEGRRVESYRYSAWELLRRLAVRYRSQLIVGACALLVLLLGLGTAWLRTSRERDRARAAEQDSERTLGRLMQQRALDRADLGERAEATVLLAEAARRGADEAQLRGIRAGFEAVAPARLLEERPRPPCPRLLDLSEDGRALLCTDGEALIRLDVEGGERWRVPASAVMRAWWTHEETRVEVVDASSYRGLADGDGAELWRQPAMGLGLGQVERGDSLLIASARQVERVREGERLETRTPCEVLRAFDGTPDRIAVVCRDGRLRVGPYDGLRDLLQLPTADVPMWLAGPILQPLGRLAAISVLRLTEDGATALLGTEKSQLLQVDLERGEMRAQAVAPMGPVRSIALSPDGTRALVSGERGAPRIWEIELGQWGEALPQQDRGTARFLDEDTLITLGRRWARWRLPSGPPAVLQAEQGIQGVAWSPSWWGSTGAETSRFWDRRSGRVLFEEIGLQAGKDVVALGPAGDRALLVNRGYGPNVRLLQPGTGTALYEFEEVAPDAVFRGVSVRGGRVLVADIRFWWELALVGDRLEVVRTWGDRGAGWEEWSVAPGHVWSGTGELVSAPSKGWALGVLGDSLWRWGPTGPPTRFAERPAGMLGLAIGDDGATWGFTQRTAIEVRRGEEVLLSLPVPEGRVPPEIALSPDLRHVAVGWLDGSLWVWRIADGALRLRAAGHRERVSDIEWAPDGSELLTGSWDRRLRRWSAAVLDEPVTSPRAGETWGLGLEDVLE